MGKLKKEIVRIDADIEYALNAFYDMRFQTLFREQQSGGNFSRELVRLAVEEGCQLNKAEEAGFEIDRLARIFVKAVNEAEVAAEQLRNHLGLGRLPLTSEGGRR